MNFAHLKSSNENLDFSGPTHSRPLHGHFLRSRHRSEGMRLTLILLAIIFLSGCNSTTVTDEVEVVNTCEGRFVVYYNGLSHQVEKIIEARENKPVKERLQSELSDYCSEFYQIYGDDHVCLAAIATGDQLVSSGDHLDLCENVESIQEGAKSPPKIGLKRLSPNSLRYDSRGP